MRVHTPAQMPLRHSSELAQGSPSESPAGTQCIPDAVASHEKPSSHPSPHSARQNCSGPTVTHDVPDAQSSG